MEKQCFFTDLNNQADEAELNETQNEMDVA